MNNSILIRLVGLFSFFTLQATAAPHTSAKPGWERLGSKKVNFTAERDVIHVGLREGGFTKLKVHVTGGSLNMHKMVVEYRNGQKEVIQLKHRFKQGSGSRVIDLNGRKRIIKDITFIYDSVNKPAGKATVHVFGKH